MSVPAYFKKAVDDYNRAVGPLYTVEPVSLSSYNAGYVRRSLEQAALHQILRPFRYEVPFYEREIARIKGWDLSTSASFPNHCQVRAVGSAFVPGKRGATAGFQIMSLFDVPVCRGKIEDAEALWDLMARERKKLVARLAVLVDILPTVGGNELALKGEF